MKRFNVVVSIAEGGVELTPMKQWLHQHPQHIPSGLDATTSTSHQLRDALRRQGWHVQETDTEVRLAPPDASDALNRIDDVLGIEEEDPSETSFAFERHLRDFIAANLGTLTVPGSRLKLYVDERGRDGVEYPTDVGPIDILAVDQKGDLFVIELKVERGADKAVGQLARYIGWVTNTIGRERIVNGVIVAKTIDRNLRFAASIIPRVQLFEYEVNFKLHPANELPTSGNGPSSG